MDHPRLVIGAATDAEAGELAVLRTAVASDLSRQFGHGHWSAEVTERSVARGMKHARMLIARRGGVIVATLRLAAKKPWAIDRAYFQDVPRPMYLTDMAVAPEHQRQGVGRAIVEHAKAEVALTPGTGIRLDAYDGLAGAGPFYARCGFREVGRVTYRGVPLVYFEWLPAQSE
jgi:GNAT superfamily N-acetyltransferase